MRYVLTLALASTLAFTACSKDSGNPLTSSSTVTSNTNIGPQTPCEFGCIGGGDHQWEGEATAGTDSADTAPTRQTTDRTRGDGTGGVGVPRDPAVRAVYNQCMDDMYYNNPNRHLLNWQINHELCLSVAGVYDGDTP